jgi:hypothetical protein
MPDRAMKCRDVPRLDWLAGRRGEQQSVMLAANADLRPRQLAALCLHLAGYFQSGTPFFRPGPNCIDNDGYLARRNAFRTPNKSGGLDLRE